MHPYERRAEVARSTGREIEGVEMTYEDIVFDYNNRALDDRTWGMISDRERVEFVLRVRGTQEPCICGYPSAPGVIHRTDGPCYVQESDEPVAWFAFADNNGSVPLEFYGFDKKECKYAVLVNARETGWKGTVEGYLFQKGWTIQPVFTTPQPCPECDEKQSAIDVWEGRYADKTAECEKLKAKIDLTNTLAQQSNQDHLNVRKDYQGEIIKLKAERDELAAQNQVLRNMVSEVRDPMDMSELPDISTNILNRVRYEAHLEAADLVIDLGDDSSTLDARTLTAAAKAIADHVLAADMESNTKEKHMLERPVVVSSEANSDDMNSLHGEGYGTDWIYPTTASFDIEKLAFKYCEQYSISENDPTRAKVVNAFCVGVNIGRKASDMEAGKS